MSYLFISISCICTFVFLFPTSSFLLKFMLFKRKNVFKVMALEFIDMLCCFLDSYLFLLSSSLRFALLVFFVKWVKCWNNLFMPIHFRRYVKLTLSFISKSYIIFIFVLSYKLCRNLFLSIQIYTLSKVYFLFI